MRTITADLLVEITGRLAAELDPEAILLFGSHAWGTPDEGSDVDLLIVLRDGDFSPAATELRALRSLRGLGVPKDILIRIPLPRHGSLSLPASRREGCQRFPRAPRPAGSEDP